MQQWNEVTRRVAGQEWEEMRYELNVLMLMDPYVFSLPGLKRLRSYREKSIP